MNGELLFGANKGVERQKKNSKDEEENMRRNKLWKKVVAGILTVSIVNSTMWSGSAVMADVLPGSGTDVGDSTVTSEQEMGSEDVENTGENGNLPEENQEEKVQSAEGSGLYEGGEILIYHEQQLRAIGGGMQLHAGDASPETFGTGAVLTDENGSALTYSMGATYHLVSDIPLTQGMWKLPDGFAGSFSGEAADEESPLYDSASDTIYIYNSYQIGVILSVNAQEEPVMSKDMIAETFGMGQFIYPEGVQDGQEYLTYSADHTYVLSSRFTEQTPELKSTVMTQADESEDGRKFKGQVIFTDTTDNNKEYILIGNEAQLRAIGTGKSVYTAVYQAFLSLDGWQVDEKNGKPIMLYGGDADLDVSQNGNKTYGFQQIDEKGLHGIYATGRCGVNQTSGEIDPNMDIEDSGHKYTMEENYIIFRDIELTDSWTPMMFSGTMIGSRNMAGIDSETGAIDEGAIEPVTISDVNVKKSGEIDLKEDAQGAGFFGTIGSQPGEGENLLMSKGQVEVVGLHLENVTVNNSSNSVKHDVNILDGLLGGVSWLLGLLLELFKINSISELSKMLLEGIDANPSMFAAGSFAGAVCGEVRISKCSVSGANVTNTEDRTGGFIGDIQGKPLYLLNEAGKLVQVLADILNMIPFLGLGNVVDVLLNGGLVNLSQLIPVGYVAPEITDCYVENVNAQTGIIGSDETSFNGGFAGRIEGGILQNVKVIQNENDLTVKGDKFTGGFAGSVADTEINGLLKSVADINFDAFNNQSVIAAAEVSGSKNISVEACGENGKYAGGFSGYIASSYIVDSSIANLKSVSAAGGYSGGFAGYISPGAFLSLGIEYTEEDVVQGLLPDLTNLVLGILGGADAQDQPLLSLVGLAPAYLYGCQVSGAEFTVSGRIYTGGFAGKADGARFGTSSAENLNQLKPYEKGTVDYAGTARGCSVQNLKSVSAPDGYTGGFLGYAATASMAGLLNSTLLEAGSFLTVSAQDVTVSGTAGGLTISSESGIAAGCCAVAVGSSFKNVQIQNLSSVSASNDAAGFVGRAGISGLADVSSGGLDILGLGLIEVNSLLKLAPAMQVTIADSSVSGIDNGFTVESTDAAADTEHRAGGFISESASAAVTRANVRKLQRVSTKDMENGSAGGFVGISHTGGLAELGELSTNGVVDITGLISAVTYLAPSYTDCTAEFIDDSGSIQVESASAGGFAGKMESGTVDNGGAESTAVEGISNVRGQYYAGGFAGYVTSGGLAATRGGISLLGTTIVLEDLLSVLNVYIPEIKNAGVFSGKDGLTVTSDGKMEAEEEPETAADTDTAQDVKLYELNSGSAGGFLGYGSGVRIENSSVTNLRHTTVKAPENLSQTDGSSYFGEESHYAVKAARYAGGYVGKLDIGNAASVGNGLGALNHLVDASSIGQVLDTVSSSIKDSDVTGQPGGYSVLADGTEGENGRIGHAGGFAGSVNGSLIENSDSHNFEYIIGQETAGGYVGNMEPGNVAELIGDVNVLKGVLSVSNLLQAVQSFIPRILSSSTDAVPCGGVVRAESPSGENASGGTELKGVAGGYVGHNNGGKIAGESEKSMAKRIRSVYGFEYAGGFDGYLHNADLVETGSLSILFGLIKVSQPLTAIQAVYATETNTGVTGPLRDLTYDEFKSWYEAVGKSGAYGDKLSGLAQSESAYNSKISEYYYGYEVAAGRTQAEADQEKRAGSAGGYVGRMVGSVITNSQAKDLRKVTAMRSAGGFAGEMAIGDLASVGGIEIAGLELVTANLPVLQTFIPVIKTSSVEGYASGAEIYAAGYSGQDNEEIGNAGGYVGYVLGGTISGEKNSRCEVKNLKIADARRYVGGFAGQIQPGSLAAIDTSSKDGLLNKILNSVIGTTGDLASLLNATISNITYAGVSAYGDAGFVVNGSYQIEEESVQPGDTVEETVLQATAERKEYAKAAGGFAGMIKGGIVGKIDDADAGAVVNGVKTVTAGEYAGGFFGLADVSAVAEVSSEGTNILGNLLGLGAIDALDAFRTYVYDARVTGSTASGLVVNAKEGELLEEQDSGRYTVYSGSAGGFGGTILNGTVKDSSVSGLKYVEAVNYSGGFIGHSGKSGIADVDNAGVLESVFGNLLGINAGIADVCGSVIKGSSVTGIPEGYTVKSRGGEGAIAGGFIGYGDLARMSEDTAEGLKQVGSDQTAGGFIGKTTFAYLVDVGIDSKLLEGVIQVLEALIDVLLHPDELPENGIVHLNVPGLLEIQALYENGVLSAEILGLKISVRVNDEVGDERVISVNIGDSSIEIKCDKDGNLLEGEDAAVQDVIKASLIKANRTRVDSSSVEGIENGYDVFGAGADNDSDGNGNGYTGGFVGYNDEGLIEENQMIRADTIRGAAGRVGEFSGASSLNSEYHDLKSIEGNNNLYQVYRLKTSDDLTKLYHSDGTSEISSGYSEENLGAQTYEVYTVTHMQLENRYTHDILWKRAYRTTADNIIKIPVRVYVSEAQADLMLGTPTLDNVSDPDKWESGLQDPCDDEAVLTIQKIWYDNNDEAGQRPDSFQVNLEQNGKDYVPDKGYENLESMDSSMVVTDPNVWSTTVRVPANRDAGNGTYEKYTYSITEESLAEDGYITFYETSEDGYTLYIYNYRTDELARKDTVVIDYSLPVSVDVLTNDRFDDDGIDGKAKLAGVAAVTDENQSLLNQVTEEMQAAVNADGIYGSAKVSEENIEYTLKSMQMETYERLMYAVKLDADIVKNGQNYVYGALDIIPATEIYYEDNADGVFSYYSGRTKRGTTEWSEAGNAEGGFQDTDRPGVDQVKEDVENLYGNDSHYAHDKSYSNGSSHVVTVGKENMPKNNGCYPYVEFTFKGTGFDVISVTSVETGAVLAEVWPLSVDEENKEVLGEEKVFSQMENTYYGYAYEDGEWKVSEDPDDCLYQIPILKVEDLPYGTYKVKLTPTYAPLYDMPGQGEYKVYLDAIRIYDPVNPEELTKEDPAGDYKVIQDVYREDGENAPRFTEIRDILLNAANMSETLEEGVVFVDGNGNLAEIEDYESFGPKNEVYLDAGQSISFYLWATEIPDQIQLSAKLVQGEEALMGIAAAAQAVSGSWEYYQRENKEIDTYYDLYYDLIDQCVWEEKKMTAEDGTQWNYRTKFPIVIANLSDKSDGGEHVLSITNLQWTGEGNRNPDTELVGTMPSETSLAALRAAGDNAGILLMAAADQNSVEAAYWFTAEYLPENSGDEEGGEDEEHPGDIGEPGDIGDGSSQDDSEDTQEPGDAEVPEEPEGHADGWERVGESDWKYYENGKPVVSDWVCVEEEDPYTGGKTGDVWYHMGADGLMQRGWIVDESGWKVYLLDTNGRMMHSQWVNAPEQLSLGRPAGLYHLQSDGAVQMNGWAESVTGGVYWFCNPGSGLFEKENPASWGNQKLF